MKRGLHFLLAFLVLAAPVSAQEITNHNPRAPIVLAQSGAVVTNTGIGTSEVSMVAVPFPALRASDALRITTIWDTTGSVATNDKRPYIRISTTACPTSLVACSTGTLVNNSILNTAALVGASTITIIRNVAATNAQIFHDVFTVSGVGGGSAPATAAVQTNAGGFININSRTITASTDSIKLVGYTVELIPGI